MALSPPTTTAAPAPDEVKKVKLDFSCFEQRQTLTAADIVRQIGKTLKNPVAALAEESHIIYFYQHVGLCPTEGEVDKLANIIYKVDAVISTVVALLSGSQQLAIAQNIGGPLLKMMADDLDGKPVDANAVDEANNQILLLAKSIVAASPKDHRGDPIDQQLTLPKNTFVSGQTLATRLDGNMWRLTYRQGRFYSWRDGLEQEVRYDTKTERWEAEDTQAPPVAQGLDRGYDGQQRIIRQLALRVKSVRPVAQEAQGGTLYDVTLADGQGRQTCIKIADHFLPIRQHPRHLFYEAYDIVKPGKSGYPVHLDAKNQWRLGVRVKPQQQQSGLGLRSQRFVSPRLRKAMTESLTDPHVDIATLTPPNSQGIVRSREGARYLLLGKQVIKIDKHPLLPHIYMLGPEETDKVLCRFDRRTQRFVLVPDEKGYVSSSGQEIDYVKAVG